MTEEQKSWGGVRPGAGRPRERRILELTYDQACILADALECYSNELYSSAEDYDPKPLEDLRAMVEAVKKIAPPMTLSQAEQLIKLANGKGLIEFPADGDIESELDKLRDRKSVV